MLASLGLSLAGFVLLAASGEALVRGAVSVALRLDVPPLIIGLTLVALGTSAPELLVSLNAALQGTPDIALGNVIGSNIANILLVLGAMAALAPITVPSGLGRDKLVMLAATLGLMGLLAYGVVSRGAGAAMLGLLVGYTVFVYREEAQRQSGDSEVAQEAQQAALAGGLGLALATLIAGLVGVVLGADLLVAGAIDLARSLGVSEAVIGLTIVAIGTSLPELTVSIMAVLRGAGGVALGNILGSNIANILLIVGATALVTPLAVAGELMARDGWVMLAVTLSVFVTLRSGRTMPRAAGVAYLVAYSFYMGLLFLGN